MNSLTIVLVFVGLAFVNAQRPEQSLCASVRCSANTYCVQRGSRATCEPRDPCKAINCGNCASCNSNGVCVRNNTPQCRDERLGCENVRCTAGNVCEMRNGRPTCEPRNACADIKCDPCFICQDGACVRNNNDNSAACRNQQGNTCATLQCSRSQECVERQGRAACVDRNNGNGNWNGNGNGNGNWNGNGNGNGNWNGNQQQNGCAAVTCPRGQSCEVRFGRGQCVVRDPCESVRCNNRCESCNRSTGRCERDNTPACRNNNWNNNNNGNWFNKGK